LIGKYSENPKYLEKLSEKFQPGQVYVIINGQEPMSVGSFRNWLRDQRSRAILEKGGDKDSKLDTIIIIRAHRETDYKYVYEVMETCRNQGYNQLFVRVLKV
jgi:biopolymer transport protein ExbD